MKRRPAQGGRLRGRRAELDAKRRAAQEEKWRRRRRWLLWLLLLLLLLLYKCRCTPEPVVLPAPAPTPTPEPAPVTATAPPTPPPARLPRIGRPAFQPVGTPELPWLAAFRLQVAARSPRLAECFLGASQPGTLKWTASVDPVAGRVSDQELEPTLTSEELTSAQRACVLGVLADPVYRLDAGSAASTPSRVGMGIEF